MSKRISFNYIDGDEANAPEFPESTQITASFVFSDESTWDVVLEAFVKFLGHCWGYDISDKVDFETMSDKLQRLRDQGVLFDDPEPWDDELK